MSSTPQQKDALLIAGKISLSAHVDGMFLRCMRGLQETCGCINRGKKMNALPFRRVRTAAGQVFKSLGISMEHPLACKWGTFLVVQSGWFDFGFRSIVILHPTPPEDPNQSKDAECIELQHETTTHQSAPTLSQVICQKQIHHTCTEEQESGGKKFGRTQMTPEHCIVLYLDVSQSKIATLLQN